MMQTLSEFVEEVQLMEELRREYLKNVKRIVIKVGTSTLTHETGRINLLRMDRLAMTISELINEGYEVILVSSGAIGVGMGKLSLKERPQVMGMKQALAAIGQCELMNIYSKMFASYNQIVAQILLTKNDVDDDIKKRNIENTFEHLLEKHVLPIVNENDTVSTDEISSMDHFGDNDTLSAVVAKLVNADLLIILSDINGFYDSDPRENKNSKLIDTVTEIDDRVMRCAGGEGTKLGTGGMVTKLNAAKIVINAGIHMVLANGCDPFIIFDILRGEKIGTFFVAKR
ncbi:glutamate 5-kinase ProB [Thermoclostridium stercorarium subsp. stercorarium DSM 8532]|jgi:glutamate 5-kinase|uniref:Glutamate 5-kinase n=2 Tax=Thermoclostridium stercorarium TaxID=1510 RepID=L7VVB3_THES1|nr:glutamate 5-kinase [Thermoclostridium stercorarium]AGC69523.1 glutamate 5-kinase ProB [Thermoclostridium stercorarium subsp. stercorarium DSM 8532]